MNPGGTALAFLLAGTSLLSQLPEARGHRRRRVLGLGCALAVVLIGLVRLGGYLTSWDAGADQLLFQAKLDREGVADRPSQPDGTEHRRGVRVRGVGLGDARREAVSPRVRPAQFLGLTAGLIALTVLIGYAFLATPLKRVRQYIPMALNTAIGFALLAAGILYARPNRGLMAVITSPGPAAA